MTALRAIMKPRNRRSSTTTPVLRSPKRIILKFQKKKDVQKEWSCSRLNLRILQINNARWPKWTKKYLLNWL